MNDGPLYDCLVILFSMLTSVGLTQRVRHYLLKRDVLDHPNERSSHLRPTPRGGGWAVVIILIPALILAAFENNSFIQHSGLLAGLLLLTGISWLDDRYNVHPGARLAMHLLAAYLGTCSLAPAATFFGNTLPFWVDRTIVIIGWAWFINLFNFMDGIDGITGVETIALATGISLVMTVGAIHDPFVSTLTLLLTGVSLGFLALNWHPAKIFLGDVGSVPLGYLTGFGLLVLASDGWLFSALILPLYYLADSGITILKRAFRGEKIWQAHRQHFYQRAAGLERHTKVVYAIIIANVVLIGAALLAVSQAVAGVALAVLTVALLLLWMHKSSLN